VNEYYGIVFEGKIDAPKAGEYTFEMASDDGARILIDGKKVVEHDGLHGQELRKGKVELKEGQHTIRVEYLAYGAPNGFRAGWTEPGSNHAKLSVESLRQKNKQKPKKEDSSYPHWGDARWLCRDSLLTSISLLKRKTRTTR
jgi:hypothetical protein